MKTRQNKSRKSENVVGKGKVTPVQVAFIVDRYLSDNSYTQTRSIFRSEVSNLLSRSPVQEAPKSLLSLSAILDEYIRLKEQRVFMDQEKVQLEQENIRVQNLFKGMQDAMNVYNQSANVSCLPPALPSTGAVDPHIDLSTSSKEGHYPANNSSVVMSTSRPWATHTDGVQFATSVTNQPSISKRKHSTELVPSTIAKRSCKISNTNQMPIKGGSTGQQSFDHGNISNLPSPEEPAVVKCLYNQTTQSPPANSSGPKTPPLSASSQAEKKTSLVAICSSDTSSEDMTPHQITSTNSTIISRQTVQISPVKQISYCSIERNHSISISSPSKTSSMRSTRRDHVKGRLDFDTSDAPISSYKPILDMVSTPESNGEGNILDLDLPNLDSFGADFNLSDLLIDFDLLSDGSGYSGQPTGDFSGSPSGEANYGANQLPSHSSKVDDVFSDYTDMPGPGCVTTMKSMTKCIKMLSPGKRQIYGTGQ